MQINELNYEEKVASLLFSREEIHILREAMSQYVKEKPSEDSKWLHLQLIGVDDILKDGNFTRFLSYHRCLVQSKEVE